MMRKATLRVGCLLIFAATGMHLNAAAPEPTPLGKFEEKPEVIAPIAERLSYDELINLAQTSRDMYKTLLPEIERRRALIKYWTENEVVKVAETKNEKGAAIYDIRLSPDGTKVVYYANRTIYVWDITTNKTDQFENYYRATISPDGTILAARPLDQKSKIDLLDIKKKTIIKSRTFKSYVNYFSFSPDGKIIGVNLSKDPITLWDWKPDTIKELPWKAGIKDLSFSHDGTMLAAVPNHELIIWDIARGKEIARFDRFFDNTFTLDSVIFSPDHETVAIGVDYDGILWNFRTNTKKTFKMKTHSSPSFSPDGMILACVTRYYDEVVELYNAHTGQEIKKIKVGYCPENVIFSSNGKKLIVDYGFTIEVYAAQEKKLNP